MKKVNNESIEKALEILRQPKDSKLVTHLNACVHCGLCGTSCMYYLAMKDPKFMPAYKVDIVASIYRRYCTTMGKVAPAWVNARELNEYTIDEMVDALFGGCTMCGRCVKHCSIGVDIPYVVRIGRMMLAQMGLVPETLQSTVNAALETGNNMGIPTEEFVDTIEWMQEDLQDDLEDPEAEIPLNKSDVNLLYTLNPREPMFFPLSIVAAAKVFYAAKESWTLSTDMYDVTNYAFFSGNNEEAQVIVNHLAEQMTKLNCKTLILGECGHGGRAFRWEGPNFIQKKYDFPVVNLVELLADYIKTGRIKVDKSLNQELCTIHDPCNLVRNGGLLQQLRYVVKESVSHFVEMNPHGNDAFCCGGGGGQLAMSEYNERRLKVGELKAEQIRATGAKVVITPCHNCVDQLTQLNHTYKLGIKIKTLAEIVADALVIEK